MGKGKTEFTRKEYEEIRSLISQLEIADSVKKKSIRSKIRNIGLFWSEIASGMQYTVDNFDLLIQQGIIRIIEDKVTNIKSIQSKDNREPKEKKSSKINNRVFISYKRKDKEPVFNIKEKIENSLGEICWIDLDGIESDAQFVSVIIKAIKECEIFLFMYSSTHNKIEDYTKDWTIRELQYAEQLNKKIVFINIDRSDLGDWFSFMFGQKQQVDAQSKTHLNRLINDLKSWLKYENIDLEKKEDILNIESEDTEDRDNVNKNQPFYYIEDILSKFSLERKEQSSKYSPMEKELYVKIDWEQLYNFIKDTLEYCDLTRTYLANNIRCFFDRSFIKEKNLMNFLKRVLYTQQFENDLKKFIYNRKIYPDNIKDKHINWDAYIEYMRVRYNIQINKWEIFIPKKDKTVELNDIVSRIVDKTIRLRIPIYTTNN